MSRAATRAGEAVRDRHARFLGAEERSRPGRLRQDRRRGRRGAIVAGGRDFFASRSRWSCSRCAATRRSTSAPSTRCARSLRALSAGAGLVCSHRLGPQLGTAIAPDTLDPSCSTCSCCQAGHGRRAGCARAPRHDQRRTEPAPERAERFLAACPYDAGFGSLIRPADESGNDEYERGLAFYATSRHGAATPRALARCRPPTESFQSALTLWPSFGRLMSTARAAARSRTSPPAASHISRPRCAPSAGRLRPRRALPRPQPAFRAADPGAPARRPVAGLRHHRDAREARRVLRCVPGDGERRPPADDVGGPVRLREMERRRQLALLRRARSPRRSRRALIRRPPDWPQPARARGGSWSAAGGEAPRRAGGCGFHRGRPMGRP